MFSALANAAGAFGGYISCGHSGVWLPTGDALCQERSARAALLIADLDPAQLQRFRAPA